MSESIFKLKLDRADLITILEESRKKKECIDVQLQIGGKLFDAHRVVLSAYSPVLKAMISDQWSTTRICPISSEYVDPSIVEELLHFLYTGSIDLTPDNVHPVCVAAHFLQIATLLQPAVQHLCRLISVDNVLTLFEFSLNSQLDQLRDSCIQLIARNNAEIFHDCQILKFSARTFNDLIAGLEEQLETIPKEKIFDCIVRWTEVNLSERLDELPGLLKSIPLEELPYGFLTRTVSTHPLVEGSVFAMQTVSDVIENYHWRNIRNLIVYGIDRDTQTSTIRRFDWPTKSWKALPDLFEHRRNFDCIIFNERDIVVFGGVKPNRFPLAYSVEMFDWATQRWKKLADLPRGFPPIKYALATLNGHLYVAGGELQEGSYRVEQTKLYCYSFETQQWQPLQSLNHTRRQFQLIGFNNHLYAFGGGTDIVEKYDPVTDQWSVLEHKSIDLKLYRATLHLGKIYARSSFKNRFQYLRVFDPETGVWSDGESYFENKDLVSMNGRLLTLDANGYILEFNFSTQTWEKFSVLDIKLDKPRIIAGKFN